MTNEEQFLLSLTYKIKHDFKWYSERFLKIRDKKQKLIDFKLNKAQLKFLDIIEQDKKNDKPGRYIILKARQLGFSTFTEGFFYYQTSTNEYVNSLIIAHEDKATQNLFSMSKLFYDESPEIIRPMKKYSNEKALSFENPTTDTDEKKKNPGLRSKITVATAGTSDTARSGTFHNVHVSEIAFFPNPKNTMTALLQCVPDEPNTCVVMESTANGIGGYFYDMWNDAVSGKNDFTPLFFPWFEDYEYTKEFPDEETKREFVKAVNYTYTDSSGKQVHTEEYLLKLEFNLTYEQLYWRDRTIANKCNGDVDMFKQEYPATPREAFISSGRPVFNLKAVKDYELKCREPISVGNLFIKDKKILLEQTETGFLKIFFEPLKDELYTIGADVAEGLVTGDYSVGVVVNEHGTVCAKWRGHIDPDLFGKELVKLGCYYNEAYIAVENNNHGLTTLRSIINEGYYNVFYSKIYDKVANEITKKLGWSTTPKTKPIMIDKLSEYIREHILNIYDVDIINELYTYIRDDHGRTNAQQGKHDDCVMALAICVQALLENYEDILPEVVDESGRIKRETDVPEIIDSAFEEVEIEEFSE